MEVLDSTTGLHGNLPIEALQRIDDICVRYEEERRQVKQARVQDFLGAAAGPERSALLCELLKIELHYRYAANETPSPEEYSTQFPQDGEAVQAAFAWVEENYDRAAKNTVAEAPLKTPRPQSLPEVPGYRLLSLIGSGGMGVVYKAEQTALKRVVALKMMLYGNWSSSDLSRRFRREAEMLAQIQHENIVRVYDVGEAETGLHFCMEFVAGGSLNRYLAGRPVPPRSAAALIETLARAVHVAHQAGIIHRDLKPANILLAFSTSSNEAAADEPTPENWFERQFSPKVTDFGLAKKADESTHTMPGAVLGTPCYMAPEQASGINELITPATDVYALGAVFYELLTGKPPFKAKLKELTIHKVLNELPRPPRELNRAIPAELEAICLKCLEKSPKRRYGSACEMADDLGRWLSGKPTMARPRRWPTRVWRRVRRHPVLLAGVFVLLAGAAALYWGDPERINREIKNQLRDGQFVTLIGDTGQALTHRLRLGAESTHIAVAPEGSFAVHTWDLCLLELVSDPQHDRYRFSAKVRHEKSDTPGRVGIYFAHRAYSGRDADFHVFTRLNYDDIRDIRLQWARLPQGKGPEPLGNDARIIPQIYSKAPGAANSFGFSNAGKLGAIFEPAGVGGGGWRDLEVNVGPDQVTAYFDGILVGSIPVDWIVKQFESGLKSLREQHPDQPLLHNIPAAFPCRGGLGLYVYRGSAYFRSVRVFPLRQE